MLRFLITLIDKMLQRESFLNIVDNTAVVTARCLSNKYSYVGDILTCSTRALRSINSRNKKLKLFSKGQIIKCVILSSCFPVKRFGNIIYRSQFNTACILQFRFKSFSPVGTRVKGIVFREVGSLQKFKKLLSLCEYTF